MKKILLLAGLTIASLTTFAQTTTFGVNAGANFSKLTSSADGGSASTQSLTGFHVGGVVDIGFSEQFSIQPGLLFSTKGGKSSYNIDVDGTNFSGSAKITLNYLEVPVNFIYKAPAGEGNVFIGAGPYVGYGLSASSSVTGDGATQDGEGTKFGSGDDDIKRVDFGVNFLVGYQLKQGLAISAGYGLGIANLSNSSDNGNTKNQVVTVSLGYFFK